jgi:hypothetical protein
MSEFKIVRTNDPLPHRDQILSFWNAYLPGTPQGRFDWMRSGNPAGPAIWFLAFERNTGELAGTISLVPRQLYAVSTEIRAGIMGDFMVGERYRIFGPYLMLLRETTGSRADLGLDCIYTIPNPASRKPSERVGMEKVKDLHSYVKPLMVKYYLEKHAPTVVASALSPLVSAGLKLVSKELFVSRHGVQEEALDFDTQFDDLWLTLRERACGLIGDRSAQYLTWRYAQNPLYQFRLLTCRGGASSQLEGYTLFTLFERNKLKVYDICALDDGITERLIATLVGIARREGCQAIYYRAPLSNHKLRIFKQFRFFNAKDALELYYKGRSGIPLESWDFTSGDRNI